MTKLIRYSSLKLPTYTKKGNRTVILRARAYHVILRALAHHVILRVIAHHVILRALARRIFTAQCLEDSSLRSE